MEGQMTMQKQLQNDSAHTGNFLALLFVLEFSCNICCAALLT